VGTYGAVNACTSAPLVSRGAPPPIAVTDSRAKILITA
jgi:hypothetical protein